MQIRCGNFEPIADHCWYHFIPGISKPYGVRCVFAEGSSDLSSDYRFVENGMRPEQPRPYVFSLTRILTDLLVRAKRDHDVAPVIHFVQDSLSRSQGALEAAKVACSDGCWFCCTRWVDAKVPEVLYIARGLRTRPDRIVCACCRICCFWSSTLRDPESYSNAVPDVDRSPLLDLFGSPTRLPVGRFSGRDDLRTVIPSNQRNQSRALWCTTLLGAPMRWR